MCAMVLRSCCTSAFGRLQLLHLQESEGVEDGFGDEGGRVDEFGALAGGGIRLGAVGVVAEGAEAIERGAEGAEVIGIAEATASGGQGFEITKGRSLGPELGQC